MPFPTLSFKTSRQMLLIVVLPLVLCGAAVLSCNKKFDAPPAYIPPNISANTTIAALKAMHTAGQADAIATDLIIAGVVIANDSSGNFYKQIILQDSTGGIAISVDDYNLYTSFPIGREVFVQLNGLYMNDDGGLMYIGVSPDADGRLSGIPSRLRDEYLVKGELGMHIKPIPVTVQQLKADNDRYAYTLVQLDSFEVKTADTGRTYANAVNKTDASIIVRNCAGDSMVVRTSGFSSFAGANVPNGNGTLTAVYAYYKSPYSSRITPQVLIRDTADVQFNGTRCNGTQPPVGNGELKSIQQIRAMYEGKDILLGAYSITGIVISDAASKNVSAGSVIIQDGQSGIAIYFGGAIGYQPGDSILLDVTGDSLINYRGSLEIKTPYGAAKPAPIATGRQVEPATVTVRELTEQLSDLEFTLVKIKNAVAQGSGSFAGSQTLSDATGSMVMYTSFSALFAGNALPADTMDWTGYGSFYNSTRQFQIRNLQDVE